MLPDWLERCCDFFAPRISAAALSDVALEPQSFERFTQHLIASRQLRRRSLSERAAVLEAPGRWIGNLNKVIPKLRYQLELSDDGRIRIDVFEHVVCSRKSREAAAMRRLCADHLEQLLQLLAEWQAAEARVEPGSSETRDAK